MSVEVAILPQIYASGPRCPARLAARVAWFAAQLTRAAAQGGGFPGVCRQVASGPELLYQ